MASEGQRPASTGMFWGGWIMSILPSLLLLFSGSMKLTKSGEVVQGFQGLGYPEQLIVPIGIAEIGCTLIYLFPPTAVLGAILLTGYLGGAVATHARLLQVVFLGPLFVGVLVWLGLFLRDPRLRMLIPIRK